MLVGDLETLDLVGYFGIGRFDVVIFGDVLEHLRWPLDVLREARPLLVPGGCVVLSIPNIAHGSVRLALLRGEWRYRPLGLLGLLDDTHLRFFTRDTVEELLRAAGLVPVDVRRTMAGLFDTELGIRPGDFPPELVQRVLDDPEATTYQFVVRAVVEGADSAVRELHEREEAAWREVHQLSGQIAQLRVEVERLYRELTALHATRTLRSTRRARAQLSTRLDGLHQTRYLTQPRVLRLPTPPEEAVPAAHDSAADPNPTSATHSSSRTAT